MRYKNIVTGAILDSPSNIISKNWIAEDKPMPEKKGLDKYTKNELYKILESQDVDYKPEQTKKELIALLEGD